MQDNVHFLLAGCHCNTLQDNVHFHIRGCPCKNMYMSLYQMDLERQVPPFLIAECPCKNMYVHIPVGPCNTLCTRPYNRMSLQEHAYMFLYQRDLSRQRIFPCSGMSLQEHVHFPISWTYQNNVNV